MFTRCGTKTARSKPGLRVKMPTFRRWRGLAGRTHGTVHEEVHPVCVRLVEKMSHL